MLNVSNNVLLSQMDHLSAFYNGFGHKINYDILNLGDCRKFKEPGILWKSRGIQERSAASRIYYSVLVSLFVVKPANHYWFTSSFTFAQFPGKHLDVKSHL